MSYAISVDVAAAVRALTERTRPSLAFDVVRVVRRALALGASRVDVNCAADRFTVRWQGAAAPREAAGKSAGAIPGAGGQGFAAGVHADAGEIALIERVLTASSSDNDAQRASALLVLEERYSLALLAVLSTSERAELHGPVTVAAARGRMLQRPAPSATNAVIVWRKGNDDVVKSERRELARWCRHADAPVVVDGSRIDKPFRLPGARGVRMVRGPGGRAIIGIVDDPARSRIVLYSYGVYVGVRSRPRGSLPLVAHVSVRNFGPEDDTRAANHAADVVVAAAEARLMAAVANSFRDLSRAERRAIREALLDSDGRTWRAPLDTLPLFDAVGAPFSLSLADLRAAGVVPATAYARGHLPGTPLLDTRARSFLRKALGDDALRAALPASSSLASLFARIVGTPRVEIIPRRG